MTAARKNPPARRLSVESLEDRTTQAAVPLASGGGGGGVAYNGFLYFTGSDPAHGTELWRTDGTPAGTGLVADLNPGAGSSGSGPLGVAGGTLYFRSKGAGTQYVLWATDGTAGGTRPITAANGTPLVNPGSPVAVNDTLLFNTFPPGAGASSPWRTDGTTAGTVPLPNVGQNYVSVPGTAWAGSLYTRAGASVRRYDPDANRLDRPYTYISGNDSRGGSQLPMLSLGGSLIFDTVEASGLARLWKTDGTAAGTTLIADVPIAGLASEGTPSGLDPTPPELRRRYTGPESAVVNGLMYLPARSPGLPDGAELWATDGTAAGTRLVKDINPNVDQYGTGIGSRPYNMLGVGNTLYFVADDGTTGLELWKSDGTEAGTVLVADISPGAGGSSPAHLTNVRGRLYFTATDPAGGQEVWTSDGTAAGTVRVDDLNPGPAGSQPLSLATVGGRLVFSADDGTTGRTLWAVDPGLPNRSPVARAAGPAAEGPIRFSGTDSADPDGDPLAYLWAFSDGTTSAVRDPLHTFPDDGAYTATLTVTDPSGAQSTSAVAVTVANVAPTTTVTSTAAGTGGSQVSVSFTAADPSPADTAAGFTYRVDWGDGVVETVPATPGNGAGLTLSHNFVTAGVFRVRVSAADQDGDYGPAAASADIVAGSPGNDTITLTGPEDGTFAVTVNGSPAGTATYRLVFPPSGSPYYLPFLVLGGAGNDTIRITNWERTLNYYPPLVVDGQGGSDTYVVDYVINADADFGTVPDGFPALQPQDTGSAADADQLLVNGTAGDDIFYKGAGSVRMYFANEYDVFYTGIEAVTLNAGAGNDQIYDPDSANVTLLGGPGDDTITVADTSGAVTVDGGDGSDTVTVQFGNITGPVTVRDTGTTGSDTLLVRPADGGPALTATGTSVSQGTQTVTVAGPPGSIPIATPAGTPPPQVTNGAVLYRTESGATDLLIGGTAGNDALVAYPADKAGGVGVWVNGVAAGTFRPTGRVAAYGYAGNDALSALGLAGRADLFGGDGGDILIGGGGPNVLVGGAGNDLLYGGAGRDVLIGGAGSDVLAGGGGDDLFVAGTTAFDADEVALGAVLAEWTSARSYAARVANLTGTGAGADFAARANGGVFLRAAGPAPTVADDGVADLLVGGGGREVFFAQLDGDHQAARDLILDRLPNEYVIDLTYVGP